MSTDEKKAAEAEAKPTPPSDNVSISQHTAVINGQTIAYTVTCGTIILKEEAEKEGKSDGEKGRASIFFVAYTKDDVEDVSTRPLSFSFNGGPGSSSIWMHLGLLGPRRVETLDGGQQPAPPYKLVNNDYSLLDQSDLVFIDPVSTGFSRPLPGEKARDFHGFKKDIESVGDFIRLYVTRYGRWSSPKFLVGESYGTLRAAGLSGYLQDRHALYINGLMLISAVLNFQTIRYPVGNDLPYSLYLPTLAATAWYHNKLAPDLQADLQKTVDEVRQFALTDYTVALMQGSNLPSDKRAEIEEKLARYTGLSLAYVQRCNLRIDYIRFCKELLRDEAVTVGRLDSRFTGYDRDSAGERFEYDPFLAAIMGQYTATFNDYVRRDLKFETDIPYESLTAKVWPWNYEPYQNEYANVAETLRHAMTTNQYLKVFVANGYYDLATPFVATEYTFSHIGLPAALMANISMAYYEAGHMMYVHQPSLAQLKQDLDQFLATAVDRTS